MLENILANIQSSYVAWCEQGGIKPSEKDIQNLNSVILDGLRTVYNEKSSGQLTLKGKDSGREAKLVFSLSGGICKIAAWNQNYEIPLHDLRNIKKAKIDYESSEKSGVWAYCYYVVDEAQGFAQKLLDKVEKDEKSEKQA